MTAVSLVDTSWRSVTLTGGVLDGCTARVRSTDLDRGVIPIPAHHGRYVRLDTDEWFWETDHAP